jgi:hypothetical protein
VTRGISRGQTQERGAQAQPGCRFQLASLSDVTVAPPLLSRWLRFFHVDDERPLANKGEDELLWFVYRIDIPVDEVKRYMEEAALFDLGAVLAAAAKIEARPSFDQVAEHLTVAVMVPARRNTPLDASADENHAIRGEGDLTHDPCGCVGLRQPIRANSANSFSSGH